MPPHALYNMLVSPAAANPAHLIRHVWYVHLLVELDGFV